MSKQHCFSGIEINEVDRVEPFDGIIISGRASCPEGLLLVDIEACVSTVQEDYIKIWPMDRYICDDGKIWLPKKDIKRLVIVDRD